MAEPNRKDRGIVDEKVDEKRDEKEEKTWDEKWGKDMLGTVTLASILIWIGAVLLGRNVGLDDRFAWWSTWAVIMSGVGAILLVEALVRLLSPARRKAIGGNAILGLVFLGVGLQSLFGLSLVWPALLIGAGLVILVQGVARRRPGPF